VAVKAGFDARIGVAVCLVLGAGVTGGCCDLPASTVPSPHAIDAANCVGCIVFGSLATAVGASAVLASSTSPVVGLIEPGDEAATWAVAAFLAGEVLLGLGLPLLAYGASPQLARGWRRRSCELCVAGVTLTTLGALSVGPGIALAQGATAELQGTGGALIGGGTLLLAGGLAAYMIGREPIPESEEEKVETVDRPAR
jgi:hypothetical protein